MDRLTMHWRWLGTWRVVSQCWSTLAVVVSARQPSTFVCMQDVPCTPLLVLRGNGNSSKSSFHRYLNGLWRDCTELWFCILFCMGFKLGFSQWGKNSNWECFRVKYWGRYLGLKVWKEMETGENCVMRSFMICVPHQILCGWDGQEMWHIQVEK